MALGICLSVAVFLFWSMAECADLPSGIRHMECHERYFMIAADLSFTGEEPYFEAVDETGAYPIIEQYAAKCGYTVRVFPLQGLMELRASYFSCHAGNTDDQVFLLSFNLIGMHEGVEVTYALNMTCSPAVPWSPREVTCATNYMEVTVRSDVTCPSGTRKDDWNALKSAHSSTTSDWQVMFQKGEEQLPPMSLSEAQKQGYVFHLTDGRLVFRTAYGQPDSFSTEVNGVPVEVVHVILFSRQSWVVIMVDMVAACSKHEGSFNGIYLMWKTPENLYPSLNSTWLNIGLNGELVEWPVAEERGYMVNKYNSTFEISIPYNAEGGYRKSFMNGSLFDFYIFHLYFEQILLDEDQMETRLRLHKTITTPLLPRLLFIENRTLPEDRMFTVYLGNVPEDTDLVAIHLNGEEFTVPLKNASSRNITKEFHLNTRGYTLMVPFDDPVVIRQFLKEDGVLKYTLDVNYTLTVLPGNKPYYHPATIVALLTDVAPPAFNATCTKSGISFKLDHQPFNYLWEHRIGSDLLTPELAAQRDYVMRNDSQSLQLDVPLFTHGYKYNNITLKGFFGTFEILMCDLTTSEVQSSAIKTCPFTANEYILCSSNGRTTVVADLSLTIQNGGIPARTTLVDRSCQPKESDDTRALFSFPLNSCGTTVKLNVQNVTYENEIFYSKNLNISKLDSGSVERVILQCTYPLAGLHRLFSLFKFESDVPGFGTIIHTADHGPSTQPIAVPPTTHSAKRLARKQLSVPAPSHAAQYIKVPQWQNLSGMRGIKGPWGAAAQN